MWYRFALVCVLCSISRVADAALTEKTGTFAGATPDGSLCFEAAGRIFPTFIEMILHEYKVAGTLHIAGISNGGISAFHVAALASAIKPMCIFMHVGDRDAGWRSEMEEQSKALAAKGFSIRLGVEKNEDHVVRAADLAGRMLDEIESCSLR